MIRERIRYKLFSIEAHKIKDEEEREKEYLKKLFKFRMKETLDLQNPISFNQKLQWLKLYDRRPEYTDFVDKYKVKEIIDCKLGKGYTIPTIGVWNHFDEIDFNDLPEQFVLKCTHDSGGVVICKSKTKFNFSAAKYKLESSLSKNYYTMSREWPYKNVPPRIIAEPYMVNGTDNELKDYKIMCYNGEAKCVFTCTDRYSEKGLKVTFFDMNWNKMPFKRHYPIDNNYIPKPSSFNQMIEFSQILSKGIPFVRVDFYEINRKPYFGEMTFYPGAGMEEFTPREWDDILGSWISLPDKTR